jgi:hypothetical protein
LYKPRSSKSVRYLIKCATKLVNCASGADCPSLPVVLALGAAQHLAILLHQHREDLLADVDAELEEGVLNAGEVTPHRKRDLDRDGLGRLDELEMSGLAGMLGHGGSFVVGYPVRTTRTVKEPPLSIPQFNSLWDIPFGTSPLSQNA